MSRQKGDTCAPLATRLWRRVQKTKTCWLWMGSKNKLGYGHINVGGGKYRSTHIVAYQLAKGPVPIGTELDHLCRNPSCCNPEHLEPVPHRINTLRGVAPAMTLHRNGVCQKGHPVNEASVHRYQNGPRKGRIAYCRLCRREKRRLGKWK